MIAAVKGWHAAVPALLFLIPARAGAAEDLNAAARELARKTVSLAGREPVSVTWRNLSSLGSLDVSQARTAFENAMREGGARVSEIAPVAEARFTLSENASEYLMVEEIRKGDDRQVFMASWRRSARPPVLAPGLSLEKKLLWEQEDAILDVAFSADRLLVLSSRRVASLIRKDGQWSPGGSADLPANPWPRDLRGRLRLAGDSYQASLPGTACKGSIQPLTLECQPSGDAWLLESGSRAMLLASFAPNRNYFDGHITTQAGVRKTIAPFYSVAAAEEQGRQIWVVAMLDGKSQIFDANFEPAGSIPSWGSDIAGTDAHCGGGAQILATRPGEAGESDTIQAFAIVNRSPVALTASLGFSGPITALWTSGSASAIAVEREAGTGNYAAYIITVACGL